MRVTDELVLTGIWDLCLVPKGKTKKYMFVRTVELIDCSTRGVQWSHVLSSELDLFGLQDWRYPHGGIRIRLSRKSGTLVFRFRHSM